MNRLIVLALFGFIAQVIDGSLGMAYGATSTSLLLFGGLSPATASASVHLAEVGTTLVAGASHWRFGNVNWKLALRLGIPGAAGALAGATFLSALSTEAARPITAGVLLAIGAYILVRFTVRPPTGPHHGSGHTLRTRFVAPLGVIAGFIDASGGGGWGPVATPTLLVTDRVEPRKVIGTVDTSEFLVTTAASIGFLASLGTQGFSGTAVVALLIGGVFAAPLAAWLVSRIPPPLLGASVGGLLVLTNAHALIRESTIEPVVRNAVYSVIVLAWITAIAISVAKLRRPTPAAVVDRPDPDDQPTETPDPVH